MSNCELCGEPMPTGEEMFKYHGLTGPCPVKPTEYDLLAIAKRCVCEPLSRPIEEIERIGEFALNMRSENDRLRAEVERLCELLSDIKKFDIENNSLDLPQEIRARIQRALDNQAKQEEGK